MATLNRATKELTCKIVYYGPGWGGKTTNLQMVHDGLPDEAKGALTSISTREDRTLFFDLLPVEIGSVGDYRVKVQLYTVPGQVHYNATRRVVLKGADGVVMVFDSNPEREDANYISLANLEENLESYGKKIDQTPCVFQFNKRDLLDAMDLKFMSASLNPDGAFPEFEASAIDGIGVSETVERICSMVFAKVETQLPRKPMDVAPATSAPQVPEEPTKAPAQPQPSAPASAEVRECSVSAIRQLCDLLVSGIFMGHAVMSIETRSGVDGAPDLNLSMEVQPLVGRKRVESLEMWRLATEAAQGEVYETRPPEGAKSERLTLIRANGRSTQAFLSRSGAFGRTRIVPRGSKADPSLERGAA